MELKTFVRANWDRLLAVGLVLVGILALIIGWFGVSGTGLAAEQNPYLISGGVAGIAMIAIGCTVWLSADLQDEWRRLDALEERLGQLVPPTVSTAAPVSPPANENGTAADEPAPRPLRARAGAPTGQ